MDARKYKYWSKKLLVILAVSSASALLCFSALAQFYPRGYSLWRARPPHRFESEEEMESVADLISANQSLTKLKTALSAAGLRETLAKNGNFTVFAPTDRAFAALPAGTWERLLRPENKPALVNLLKYHLVLNRITETEAVTGKVTTWMGSPVTINVNPNTNEVNLNDARVLEDRIEGSNGMIIVIDKVLVPPDLAANFNLR